MRFPGLWEGPIEARPLWPGGSSRLRAVSVPVPEALADLEVLDPDGREVRLGELWADRPAVLVFVRHFG